MGKNMMYGICLGLVSIIAIVFICSFVISLLLKFTTLTEASFSMATLVISFAALFIGGLISGAKARRRGVFIGAGTGFVYGLLVFLIQYLGFDTGFTMMQYVYFLAYIAIAALGGMVGVSTLGKNVKI